MFWFTTPALISHVLSQGPIYNHNFASYINYYNYN